jgi:hypothetical protein
MIFKERFFDASVQNFLGLLHDKEFFKIAESLQGYDVRLSGRMLFPKKNLNEEKNFFSNGERSG